MSIERVITMDSRNYAKVQLDNVAVSEHAKLGNYKSGAALLEKTLDSDCWETPIFIWIDWVE